MKATNDFFGNVWSKSKVWYGLELSESLVSRWNAGKLAVWQTLANFHFGNGFCWWETDEGCPKIIIIYFRYFVFYYSQTFKCSLATCKRSFWKTSNYENNICIMCSIPEYAGEWRKFVKFMNILFNWQTIWMFNQDYNQMDISIVYYHNHFHLTKNTWRKNPTGRMLIFNLSSIRNFLKMYNNLAK